MLRLLVAALATFTFVEPSITFTSNSVYKCDDIIDVEPIKHEDFDETFLVDIKFSQAKLLGYKIYDNPETPYIDGIKWDDEWLDADWTVYNVDFSKEHSLVLKTVYTDDYAGMVVAAKDGDWSLMLKNPETILKLVYYIIATISILVGGFSLFRNKKFKFNIKDQIAEALEKKAEEFKTTAENKVNQFVEGMTPILKAQEDKYNNIIKGIMLSKSKASEDTLALINLLESATDKDEIAKIAEQLKTKVVTEAEAKQAEIAEAKATVHAIAEEAVEEAVKAAEKPYDGTQI